MLQEISNRLIFNIDEKQETHDGDKQTRDTSFFQFSFQYLYDFDNEFRNDNQPSLIKNISIDTYSEELEDYQEINDNTNVDINISLQVVEDLKLKIGLTFLNWAEFKIWIKNFAKTKRFNYKIRTSQTDGEVIGHITYKCSRSGTHNSQVTSDSTKRQNATSQRTQCPWKINIVCPKLSNVVRINLFDDNYNHVLTSNIQEMASRFQKLTSEMLCDIKKHVIQRQMNFGSIYLILIHDYFNQIIVKKDLYNAVYQFRFENNLGDSDTSQMLKILLNWKDSDLL
ncbi:hypothetical protein RhiirA4_477341 [Rhizophagus irregularis]|uniref:FAR1 domain-containing protein n=1 Tax=Rhizophagus irregularis TaxID=588596 RepID=A0A2I1HD34_9GLOM|nr:hypothetical protein RhiirA4_477341 [Rhizophagus irregularis]